MFWVMEIIVSQKKKQKPYTQGSVFPVWFLSFGQSVISVTVSEPSAWGQLGGWGKLITGRFFKAAFSKTTTIAAVQQSRPPHAE